ncbi:hypothetical protein [Leptospira noguchii]|uniref:hypothetical protein n=1 Tax=Leptospira noguchii TaxID=28182 RepID=UPI001FB7961F|nr:hypothetical protein [Leptospira noguchii]UOG48320.1 hypothetical protein MAL00_15135 [Leptospira noguchii]
MKRFLRKRLKLKHNAFLRVALWGGNSVLQRICRNSHRFNIEIQILVGLVMDRVVDRESF